MMRATGWLAACGLGLLLASACSSDETAAAAATTGAGATGGGGGQTGGATTNTGGASTSTTSSMGGSPNYDFAIIFPPPVALTDEATITVRGTAEPGTQSVTVAGVDANADGGLDEWSVEVPLSVGMNTIDVDVVDAEGSSTSSSLDVERNTTTGDPRWLAYDAAGGRAFTAQTYAIVEHDLATGQRRRVSASLVDAVGSGPNFDINFHGLVWDTAQSRLLALDSDQLLAVDPTTGDRTTIADASTGTGAWPSVTGVNGALALDGTRAIIGATGELVAVDLTNGNRTVVASAAVGTGPTWMGTDDVVVNSATNTGYFAAGGEVIEVDLTNGNRTELVDLLTPTNGLAADFATNRLFVSVSNGFGIVSTLDGNVTSVPIPMDDIATLYAPRGIGFDGTSILAADTSLYGVTSNDLTTGARAILSAPIKGSGLPHLTFHGLSALHGTDVVSMRSGQTPILGTLPLVATNPQTGARSILVDFDAAETNPVAFDFEITGDTAIVAGLVGADAALVTVDLMSGTRTTVSSDADSGANLFGAVPRDVVRSSDGSTLYASVDLLDGTAVLFSVDASSGARTILSDATTGTGPELVSVCDLLWDPDGNLIAVTQGGVLSIDTQSGDRTLLSGDTMGDGPPIGLCGVAQWGESTFAPDGAMYMVTQGQSLLRIDLSSGDRSLVGSGSAKGPGAPSSLSYAGGLLWAADHTTGVIAIDPTTAERVIVSR